jgi:hypothetical protein
MTCECKKLPTGATQMCKQCIIDWARDQQFQIEAKEKK